MIEGAWFAPTALDEQLHTIVMTRERFAALWRSHNLLAETAGAGLPDVLAAIDAIIAPHPMIDVPYLTRAWTARAR